MAIRSCGGGFLKIGSYVALVYTIVLAVFRFGLSFTYFVKGDYQFASLILVLVIVISGAAICLCIGLLKDNTLFLVAWSVAFIIDIIWQIYFFTCGIFLLVRNNWNKWPFDDRVIYLLYVIAVGMSIPLNIICLLNVYCYRTSGTGNTNVRVTYAHVGASDQFGNVNPASDVDFIQNRARPQQN